MRKNTKNMLLIAGLGLAVIGIYYFGFGPGRYMINSQSYNRFSASGVDKSNWTYTG